MPDPAYLVGGKDWYPNVPTVEGADPPSLLIQHVENGVYTAEYNATVAGHYMILVKRDDQPIDSNSGSAFFKLTVSPGASNGPQCTASGQGLSGGTAGETQSFRLVAAVRSPPRKHGLSCSARP